jgi:Ca2+-binding EF-hand superfamily protein
MTPMAAASNWTTNKSWLSQFALLVLLLSGKLTTGLSGKLSLGDSPTHSQPSITKKASMKKACLLGLVLGLLAWLAPTASLAAKADGPKARFFAKYDKNHNGVIDEDEKDALRKDYAANPDGDLKRFDKNHDGKLDDEEIAAIKPPTGKGKAASNGIADFFAKYDTNQNGVIDAAEQAAIRKDYAANPAGPLKKFDLNNDGKLDDGEIAAIKLPVGKGKAANSGIAELLAKYDKNHNGILDDDEKDALRKDYAANPEGPLKKFDKNKDGKLDDEEIAAIKLPARKGGKAGKAAGENLKAETTTKADKAEQ